MRSGRSMVRFVFALVLSAVAALPTAASPLADAALDAAIAACAPGLATVFERTRMLADADWVIAVDTPIRREFLALNALTRFQRHMIMPDADTLASFIKLRDEMTLPQPFPAGSAPDAAMIAQQQGADLEVVGVKVALQFVLQMTAETPDSTFLRCTLLLAEPIPSSILDRAIPDGTDPAAVTELPYNPASALRIVSVTVADGASARLQHIDLMKSPGFATLPAQTGSSTRLSTILKFDTYPVSLR